MYRRRMAMKKWAYRRPTGPVAFGKQNLNPVAVESSFLREIERCPPSLYFAEISAQVLYRIRELIEARLEGGVLGIPALVEVVCLSFR